MKTNEINIRDPYVLAYEEKYYMYGTRGATCWGEANGFDVYVSTDLEEWSEAIEVFHKPEGFWATYNYWAPEVHYYKGNFYLFASFKTEGVCRGTQILKAQSPLGPFELHSDGPVTPKEWECLDGTFYLDQEGKPYMIFCHEWVQAQDGQVCSIALSNDLKEAVSEPKVLFKASEASWVLPVRDGKSFVTDGPFMYRTESGKLLMLWSSFGEEGYVEAIAYSENGQVEGDWKQDERLLFRRDGGHGMLFRTFQGELLLALHSPNKHLEERPVFYEIEEKDNWLYVK